MAANEVALFGTAEHLGVDCDGADLVPFFNESVVPSYSLLFDILFAVSNIIIVKSESIAPSPERLTSFSCSLCSPFLGGRCVVGRWCYA